MVADNNFIIDTHCHLHYDDILKKDLDDILTRCQVNNIKFLLNVSTKGNDGGQFLNQLLTQDKIKKKHNFIWNDSIKMAYSVGYHPCHKDQIDFDDLLNIAHGAVAIGETGLDNGTDSPVWDWQINNLKKHLEVCRRTKLPAIIHCRDSWDLLIPIIEQYADLKYIIHCFTGDIIVAQKLLKLNTIISISGIVTYKNATNLVESVRSIPLERLVVETDSPFLIPYNFRKSGKKYNDPSNIIETIEKICYIKNISFEKLCETTSKNFLSFMNMTIN